jgi:hypothetical protein
MSWIEKTGHYAFPTSSRDAQVGMTLLDYFAGQALQGILAGPDHGQDSEEIAIVAYGAAEAMIKERKVVMEE